MFKRTLSLLLCLVFVGVLGVPVRAEDESTVIDSVEDLLAITQNPAGSYCLGADLDLAGVDWEPIAFAGHFDGQGHTIYNLRITHTGDVRVNTVDGNAKVYDTVFAGLFSTLEGAEVKDLTLRGVDVDVTTAEHCYIGGIAGYFHASLVSGCQVLDARLTLTSQCAPDTANPRRSCVGGVGGIVGFGSGAVSACTADVTLVFDDKCDKSLKVEQFMGGVLACGNVLIDGCSVTIRGYDACHGYAHNGGLVGMFYTYDRGEAAKPISNSNVTGSITFFEDNKDRRAYCEAFVGELLTWTSMTNVTPDFQRNEVFDYTALMRPEQCAEPALTETVHPADCESCGYTEHTCTVCGNTWRDRFVPEAHEPGEWVVTKEATYTDSGERELHCALCGSVMRREIVRPHVDGDWVVVKEPDFGVPGLRQLLCIDCGAVLAEEPLPARIGAESVTLTPSTLEMDYKSEAKLEWTLLPDNVETPMVYFSSSDESVVTVEANGTLHAVGRGEAVVKCTSADGLVSAESVVTVKLTFWQWVRQYILFGWVIKH